MVLRGRHKVKMKLAFSNKGRVLKSPYYLAVHLWNQLEVDVQTSICKKDFRQKLYFIDFNNLSIIMSGVLLIYKVLALSLTVGGILRKTISKRC